MWSPGSSKRARPAALLRASLTGVCGCLLLAALAACGSSAPTRPATPAAPAPAAQHAKSATSPAPAPAPAAAAPRAGAPGAGAPGTAAPGTAATTVAAGGGNTAAAPAAVAATHPDVPPAARADFDRAVNYMRAGNAIEAELGFKQVALQYPQFAAPLVNLAIMKRKDGHLDQAETLLKNAVEHENTSALAWTELGATQSMRGEFKDAAASYHQAITVDPQYAPAWRNLGVLSDLYLGDPKGALSALEQYKQLTGEEKPVSGWIAELRQRLGIATPKHTEPSSASAPAPAAGAAASSPAAAASAPAAAASAPAATPPAANPAPARPKEGNGS
jgi:tetratricopeptide (TPR) repeat protein